MQQNPLLRVYHNLARQEFVTLYRNCAALVGNSSSLIIESSFLKVPAVLVGPRQDERERSTNVVRVEFDRQEIEAACRRAVFDPEYRTTMRECVSLYGDGHASPRIATILAGLSLDPKVLLKSMPY
jgi:GDP/UDP-N,N'-diacetylbacillosamine 2-epimerase (hydrolysing)